MSSYNLGSRYYVGQRMTARSRENSGVVDLQVKQLHEPSTLSCGMLVEIVEVDPALTTNSTLCFLKMYDRRFAKQLREDRGIPEWCEEYEESYIKFVESGEADSFIRDLQEDGEDTRNYGEPDVPRSTAKDEAFLFYECSKMYSAETCVYEVLLPYQGSLIPRLISAVSLDGTVDTGSTIIKSEYLEIKGILLEYIHGCNFSKLDAHFPKDAWQGIVDQALKIIDVLGDNLILNEDIRPENFLATTQGNEASEARVVMIDFGQSRQREQDETDKEWGRAKWTQDEEGAIGLVMQHRLKKKGHEIQYQRSSRYLEWAPGEFD